jgi:CMP-N-acetylneuraminic acid synthetase
MKTTSDNFQKLAIVPARGGSKRIPNKNKKLFNGRPIIEWTLETLIESGLFETVVVSTDEILEQKFLSYDQQIWRMTTRAQLMS